MPRVKSSTVTRRRRKRILKLAKGYYGSKHLLYRTAHEQVMRSLAYAYRDRKQRKRDFRKLWITRINAACRLQNISYSRFMYGLKLANIEINRKMLADLAVRDIDGFNQLVDIAKKTLANPDQVQTVVEVKEVKKAEPKKEPKKEVKKEEVKEKVEPKKEVKKAEVKKKAEPKTKEPETAEELAKLTVVKLRELAKERGISIPSGSKKADIVELLAKK